MRRRSQPCGDLKQLNALFSTNFQTGNTSDYTIWVVVQKASAAAGSGGSNYGYESDQSSRIFMRGDFTPPPPPPPPPPGPVTPPATTPPNYAAAVVEYPRFVFVAELAEILMDFTGYGWGRGNSMGEGLSIVLATLLHPDGYYSTSKGPRINNWLNGTGGPPRMDRVANTENTDTNQFSYGCAILFINYLVSQLGFTMTQVIKAGGGSLAQTFARLTGKPESAAYLEFNALLQKHLGNSTSNNMRRDNIFPLYEPDHRHVSVTASDPVTWDSTTDNGEVFFNIKPGIMCPVSRLGFWRHRQQVGLAVYARAFGTANAAWRWTIGGQNVPMQSAWTNLSLPVPTQIRNPDKTVNTVSATTDIQYQMVNTWNGSVLYLQFTSKTGNCQFPVEAFARETASNDAEVSATDTIGLESVWFQPDDATKSAYKRCNPFYAAIDTSIWGLSKTLADLKNRPDPPSDRAVLKVVKSVQALSTVVAQYARASNLSEADVWKQVGTPGELRTTFAPADDADLRRTPIVPQHPKKD
ncbi:MAG: hypothetical protein U0Q11_22635 [Vicinamibacterales bacterium]